MKPSEYETLVQRLMQMLLEQDLVIPASILHLAKLEGSSGQVYEIDLSYRFTVAGIDYLTIVECKQWNRMVGRNVVAAFRTIIDDLGAHKGVIVSTKGFQSGAIGLAVDTGIALLKISDKENPRLHLVARLEGPWRDVVTYLQEETPAFRGGIFKEAAGFVRSMYSVEDYISTRYGEEALAYLSDLLKPNSGAATPLDLAVVRSQLENLHDEWLEEFDLIEDCGLPIVYEPSMPVRLMVMKIRAAKEKLGLPIEAKLDFYNAGDESPESME